MAVENVLAVDPGRDTGVAAFVGGKLLYCNVIGSSFKELRHLVNQLVMRWFPMTLVVECPRIYTQAKAKGDPNGLVPLFIQVGHVEALAAIYNCPFHSFYPYEWKGQVPKKISNERTLKKLSDTELLLVTRSSVAVRKQHNMLDAIGMGLWWIR